MAKGTLIGESLRLGASLERSELRLAKIWRVPNPAPEQPPEWTLIEFELDDGGAPALAEALSQALDDRHPWYCDLHTAAESFVVFPGRVFRYTRGDAAGRAAAEAFARSRGVPEAQLDWPW
jgi:hypothetical protein